MTQELSADFSRRIFWRAALLLSFKISVVREHDLPVNGSQTPNKFGAQRKFVINHWLKPVAWMVLEHSLEPL